MSLFHGPAPVLSGLVLYFDPANPKSYPGSGSTLTDLSQRSQFTLSGTTYGQGFLTFNGSSDYLGIGTNYNYSTNYSTEVWFYILSNPGVDGAQLVRSRTYGFGTFYSMNPNLEIGTNVMTTSSFPSGNTAIVAGAASLNTWYQVVSTFGSSTISVYVNGQLITSSATVTGTVYYGGAQYMALMRDGDYSGSYANCRLGLYRHYSRTLSAQEVTQNFNATRGRYGL